MIRVKAFMNKKEAKLMRINILIFFGAITTLAYAGSPLWTLTPLTATTRSVSSTETTTVQYTVTNQSSKVHTLSMQPIQGITQLTTDLGVCGNPFILTGKASCILSLQINGSQLTSPINDGPIICQQGSTLQCYRPAIADVLHITQTPPTTDVTITVTGSPLTLTTNGSTGTLTINNTSLIVAATNVTSNFTGTALAGNVTETGNTCTNVAPQSNCTLTYSAGNTVVSQTSFPIQGSNTNAVTAAIEIAEGAQINTVSPSSGPASGGTGVTITGRGFTDATSLTFGGVSATNLHVVSSTNITAVTPAYTTTGLVAVEITTPLSSATKSDGFTYLTTSVGQSAYGGKIACLNGGLNNLIAATTDNSTGIRWGGAGITTNATSITNGATNTDTIVLIVGTNGGVQYAAALCSAYEIDSQGNTPCQSGNACYNDWFLPAGNNTTSSGQLNCLYTNRVAIGGFGLVSYWSSTEASSTTAWGLFFSTGVPVAGMKGGSNRNVRCVRAFSPS